MGVAERVVWVAGIDQPPGRGESGFDVVGPSGEGVAVAERDGSGGGHEQAADGGGDVLVEDFGDLAEGCDVGVVEGVDAPVDIVAGPVAHESASGGVVDP